MNAKMKAIKKKIKRLSADKKFRMDNGRRPGKANDCCSASGCFVNTSGYLCSWSGMKLVYGQVISTDKGENNENGGCTAFDTDAP
jgi:hypothetical protein